VNEEFYHHFDGVSFAVCCLLIDDSKAALECRLDRAPCAAVSCVEQEESH
jgi:hypothetical protein